MGTSAMRPRSKDLLVRPGKRLDISACKRFIDGARLLRSGAVDRVVIDLGMTRQLRDSGLALLLMLDDQVGPQPGRIVLVNCAPAMLRRMEETGIGARFQTHMARRRSSDAPSTRKAPRTLES
jgi:anti-anti-sigma regulatory factor